MGSGSLQRTRRNLLAAGGLLAGATLSQLGSHGAHARPPASAAHCFLRGTHLLTPQGERKVEDLRIGDLLTTLSGEAKPIEWIGRRVFKRSNGGTWPKNILPVRVARGALGPDAPRRDLFVSHAHALWVDGVLIRAFDLVNGSTITVEAAPEIFEIEYLHVKLAQHDVVLADGTPCETLLLESGNIEDFDNFAEYLRLYGDVLTDEQPYAPVGIKGGSERLRSRLRSAVSPWFDFRTEFDKARDRVEELADFVKV
jgi:hypothetical protein